MTLLEHLFEFIITPLGRKKHPDYKVNLNKYFKDGNLKSRFPCPSFLSLLTEPRQRREGLIVSNDKQKTGAG
jgi:hypothetical protein